MGDHGPPAEEPSGWQAAARCRRMFARSPFFPAAVLVLVVGAAAGLFAGSYVYAMANPVPRDIPTAIVHPEAVHEAGRGAFVPALERALRSSLKLREYPDFPAARRAIESKRVFAVVRPQGDRPGDGVALDVSSASGASLAELLSRTAPQVGRHAEVRVQVRDLKPLATGDPRGLGLFYITLAAVITGFLGAIQLSLHARTLRAGERIATILVLAVVGGFCITAVVGWGLDAVPLPFPLGWVITSMTMFASGMVFTMFNTLFGRWAVLPTWGLMVLVGSPSSGGAVSWQLLPPVLGAVGRWLPPGASVNALHTAVYFPGHQHAQPFLVLAGWAVLPGAVFWLWRHRHPGGRDRSVPAVGAEDASGGTRTVEGPG